MVPRWPLFAIFLRAVLSASRAQHVSDLRSKFTLRPHHVWKYGRHPIYDGWERRGKKQERRNHGIIWPALLHRAAINNLCIITSPAGAVEKYCDEHVCVYVCLCVCLSVREDISGTTHAISGGLKEPCIRWGGADLQREGTIFGGCPGHSKASAIRKVIKHCSRVKRRRELQ